MQTFLKTFFLFVALFFIGDKVFYVFMELSSQNQQDQRIALLMEGKVNKDIIVLGSSRGAMNVIASQLAQEAQQTCYNLSYPGSDVTFHTFILKTLLQFNEKPKTLLLALDDPSELLEAPSITFRKDKLYPFVKYNFINEVLIEHGDRNFTSHFMCLSRINTTHFQFGKERSTSETVLPCGSMIVEGTNPHFSKQFDARCQNYESANELKTKQKALLEIIEQCKKHQIELVFVFSPNFKDRNLAFEKRMQEFGLYSVKTYVYNAQNPIYKDCNYFYDASHLNRKGAEIFTKELSLFLKKM